MSGTAKYREAHFGGCLDAAVEARPDGSQVLRSTEALQAYPQRLSDRLAHWAQAAPDRTFVARRGEDGQWQRISYAQMLERAQNVGQALLQRGLSVERPLVILSENDLEHLTLAMAAMWVGVPYAPISSAYSLVSGDFAKLRHILATLTPGMVFASSTGYARALTTVVADDVEVVLTNGRLAERATTPFSALLATPAGRALNGRAARCAASTLSGVKPRSASFSPVSGSRCTSNIWPSSGTGGSSNWNSTVISHRVTFWRRSTSSFSNSEKASVLNSLSGSRWP